MNQRAPQPTLSDEERQRVARVEQLTLDGAVAPLEAMLTDPSWTVRRAVVTALAAMGQPAVGSLCQLLRLHRDHEARIAAVVDALVASTGEVEAAVIALAHDGDAAVAADAAAILGRRRSQGAVPTLVGLLRHADDNVAVAAIEALGRIGGRAAVESLVALVGSGNFFRTFPAIDVLGRSGDPRAVAPLTALLGDPHYALEAARALGRTGERSAVAPLAQLLMRTSDASIRIAALALAELIERYRERFGVSAPVDDALRRATEAAVATRRLAQSLSGADLAEQAAIARVLGALRDEAAVSTLLTLVDRPEPVASAASAALERLGGSEEAELVRDLIGGDSARRSILLPLVKRTGSAEAVMRCLADADPQVRSAACDALARIGNPAAAPSLFALLTEDNARVAQAAVAAIQSLGSAETERLALSAAAAGDLRLRRAALRILSYFGYASAFGVFSEAIAGDDPRAQEIAVQGLPFVDDPRAMEELLSASRADSERLRGAAMRALGQCSGSDPRVNSALLRGLSDGDAWVRYYACQSLGRLGVEASAGAIATHVADPAGQVRVGAIEALSHLRGDIAFAALRAAAGSEDADIRRAALVGLGLSRRSEAEALLLAAAGDSDPATRLVAVSAMADVESAAVLRALEHAAQDGDESVRTAAIGFLAARPGRGATDALVRLLAISPHERERLLSALALATPDHVAGILGRLADADDELAAQLVSALVRMRRPEANAALAQAFTLPNARARKAAASGLAAVSSAEGSVMLQRAAANDLDPEVRRIAGLLLAQ